uniref:Scavenger receptor cysteine-rich domain-containing protein DMBT1 n=1 Tax=Pogona vitticeps TaxID=103695 RepID=A0ABM5G1K8_9SAUR
MDRTVIFLWVLFSATAYTTRGQNAIRLVNGRHRCEGRVEVYYNGRWGTVCDDLWQMDNARVVCRQLECGVALSAPGSARYGSGLGAVLMDNVVCRGSEERLDHCTHRGWGVHDCSHSEDAGVSCSELNVRMLPATDVPSTSAYRCGQVFSDPEGSFTGTYYDGDGNILECLWKIQPSNNLPIKISIDYVELDCSHDYIEIFDGEIDTSAKLGRICSGSDSTFIASSGTMSVLLHRESSQEGLGFFAYYETGAFTVTPEPPITMTNAVPLSTLGPELTTALAPSSLAPELTITTSADTEAENATTTTPEATTNEETSTVPPAYTSPSGGSQCGGILTFPNGYISGPYYLGNNITLQCVWKIEVSPLDHIILRISYISLDCSKEYIEIFDGSLVSPYLLGRMCSDIYLGYNYTSTSNTMTILLHRDSNYIGYGFDAYYSSIQEPTTSAPPQSETTVPPANSTSSPLNTLSCSGEYMVARISRAYVRSLGYKEWDLYLNSSDPECAPQLLEDYVIFNIPFSGCGTVRQQTNNNTITYSNIIRTLVSGYIITRKRNFQLHVMCEMNENTVVETAFLAQDAIDIVERQYGHYNVTLAFYQSPSFIYQVYGSPYFVSLNQNLYVQATLHSSDSNLVLFVDTCVSSPYADSFTDLTYDLIRDGCTQDSTYRSLYSPRNNEARFQFNSFKFLNQHNEVYLQCKLVVCRADDLSSRCYQGCLTRRKRDVDEPREKVEVVVGPIKLQEEDKEKRKQDLVKTVHPEKDDPVIPLTVAAVLLAGMVFVLSGFLLSIKLRRNNYHQIY